MEPRHRAVYQILAVQDAVAAAQRQHVAQSFAERVNRLVVRIALAARVLRIHDAAPDFVEQALEGRHEITIGGIGFFEGKGFVVGATVVEIETEHTVVGVAASGAAVGGMLLVVPIANAAVRR